MRRVARPGDGGRDGRSLIGQADEPDRGLVGTLRLRGDPVKLGQLVLGQCQRRAGDVLAQVCYG